MTTTVFKLGGSLLSHPDLPRRLRDLLACRPDGRPLLVVGGGKTADVVREWDRVHGLGEERAHRLALRSLTLNEAFVLELLPESVQVATRKEAENAWSAGHVPVLSAHAFLNGEEQAGSTPLPHVWDVTSDSIAAWTAIHWPAEELVLLKSSPMPAGCTADEAARIGYVDSWLAKLAGKVPRIGWADLTADEPAITTWIT